MLVFLSKKTRKTESSLFVQKKIYTSFFTFGSENKPCEVIKSRKN